MIDLEDISLAGRLHNLSGTFGVGFTAILGESGAGKSSLLHILAGFEQPTRGKIRRNPSHCYWAPAEPSLWPWMNVREHVTDEGVLQLLELDHLANKKTTDLSLGEAGRLNLARSIANSAPLLLWDEPLAHADSAQRSRLWPQLINHLRNQQRNLVFTTHQPAQAILADADAVCLAYGSQIWRGSAREASEHPPTSQVGWLFGPLNEATVDENGKLLTQNHSTRQFARPHQTRITPTPESKWELEEKHFDGNHWVHRLKTDSEKLEIRTHMATDAKLGDKISVSFLIHNLILLCAFLFTSCGTQPEAPATRVGTRELTPIGVTLPAPRSLAVSQEGGSIVLDNGGRVVICDENAHPIRSFFMPEYSVGRPEGVIQRADGTIVVCDTHYHRVLIFHENGTELCRWGSYGKKPGQFIYPVAVDQDDDGNLYIGEYGGHDRVQKFTADGKFILSFGTLGAGDGEFQRPSGIAVIGRKVYVADAINERVLIFHTDGNYEGILGGLQPPELEFPYDIEADAQGRLWLVEYAGGRLVCLDTTGRLIGKLGSAGNGADNLHMPWGLAVDKKSGRIFVADTGNRRLALYQITNQP